MQPKTTLMCPVCAECVGDVRETKIPYKEDGKAFVFHLVVCTACQPQVTATIAQAHKRTGIPFHPRMLQCLWAAKINRETDVVAAAADAWAELVDEWQKPS